MLLLAVPSRARGTYVLPGDREIPLGQFREFFSRPARCTTVFAAAATAASRPVTFPSAPTRVGLYIKYPGTTHPIRRGPLPSLLFQVLRDSFDQPAHRSRRLALAVHPISQTSSRLNRKFSCRR